MGEPDCGVEVWGGLQEEEGEGSLGDVWLEEEEERFWERAKEKIEWQITHTLPSSPGLSQACMQKQVSSVDA